MECLLFGLNNTTVTKDNNVPGLYTPGYRQMGYISTLDKTFFRENVCSKCDTMYVCELQQTPLTSSLDTKRVV